jgi:hypothetical protein
VTGQKFSVTCSQETGIRDQVHKHRSTTTRLRISCMEMNLRLHGKMRATAVTYVESGTAALKFGDVNTRSLLLLGL